MKPENLATRLLDHTCDAVVTLRHDGTVVAWNHGAERLYGYSLDEVVGRPIDFLGLPGEGKVLEDLKPPSDGGETPAAVRRLRHKSGEEVVVELRAVALGDAEGSVLLFARDAVAEERESALAASRTDAENARREVARLAGRLLAAREEERRDLARELHDGVSQRLVSLALAANILRRKLDGDEAAEAGDLAGKIQALSQDVRRLSHGLHPAALERLGLAAALDAHVHELADAFGLDVRLSVRESGAKLGAATALCLYRVAQEALGNVARHAGTQRAHLSLVIGKSEARLAVADAGVGFDPDEQKSAGLGLTSMEERARLLGGCLRLTSAPGAGTEIEILLPLRGDENDTEPPVPATEAGPPVSSTSSPQ